jgi:hypothetical protein
MSTYSLRLENASNFAGDFCVYATAPENKDSIYSLAWFTKRCVPESAATFLWDVNFSFMWEESGLLVPGVTFKADQDKPTEPNDIARNSIVLTHEGGSYDFIPPYSPKHKTTKGNMGIFTDGTIPHGKAALGIGINGASAFATQATPNFTFTFIPHLRYWVTFGNYIKGEVLDLNAQSDVQELIYDDPNNLKKILKLNKSNKWEIIE